MKSNPEIPVVGATTGLLYWLSKSNRLISYAGVFLAPLLFFFFFSSSDSLDELDDELLYFLLDFLSLFLTSTFTTSLVTVVTCFDDEDDFSSKLPIGLY